MSLHPTAALGDVGSSDLALTLALRVCDFYHTEYRPQELSNVVWALGTLGVLCAPTLDTVLAGVSKLAAVLGAIQGRCASCTRHCWRCLAGSTGCLHL